MLTRIYFQFIGIYPHPGAHLMGGHGPLQTDRTVMTSQRNYIEELTGKVAEGKQAGLSVAEMQKRFTVASLKFSAVERLCRLSGKPGDRQDVILRINYPRTLVNRRIVTVFPPARIPVG